VSRAQRQLQVLQNVDEETHKVCTTSFLGVTVTFVEKEIDCLFNFNIGSE